MKKKCFFFLEKTYGEKNCLYWNRRSFCIGFRAEFFFGVSARRSKCRLPVLTFASNMFLFHFLLPLPSATQGSSIFSIIVSPVEFCPGLNILEFSPKNSPCFDNGLVSMFVVFFPPLRADHLSMSTAILLTNVWLIKKIKLGKGKLRKPNPTSKPFSRADCSAQHLVHQGGTGILVNFMPLLKMLNYRFPRFCRISAIHPTDTRKSPQTKHILSSVRMGPQCSKCWQCYFRRFWNVNCRRPLDVDVFGCHTKMFPLVQETILSFSDHHVQHCEFPTRKGNQIFPVDRSSVPLPKKNWSEILVPL